MYIITKNTRIILEGFTDIKVYDKEDLNQMEPKVDQYEKNDTENYILGQILAHLKSSTGNTTFALPHSSGWFTQRYPGTTSPLTTITEQDGKNGIFARVDDVTALVSDGDPGDPTPEDVKDFLLHDAANASYATNVATWTAQASWGGGTESGGTTTVEELRMGRDYMAEGSQQGAGPDNGFGEDYAINNVTDFTMDVNDILKVTWTITIG